MKSMTVTQFKAHALQVISEVSSSQESLVVTKRGKPVVAVVPYRELEAEAVPGRLAHMFVNEEDIVSPLGAEMWGAAR